MFSRIASQTIRQQQPAFARALRAPSRSIMTLKSSKYTAEAIASGAGRNGSVSSGSLDFNLAMPKELGGSGNGQNPEQLFAMGYSACFLSAIQAVARQQGKDASKAKVFANVSIGEPNEASGFALSVDIKAEGVDEELLKTAHEFCPYSRALNHGIEVNVSTV